jgi:hypothetical protein
MKKATSPKACRPLALVRESPELLQAAQGFPPSGETAYGLLPTFGPRRAFPRANKSNSQRRGQNFSQSLCCGGLPVAVKHGSKAGLEFLVTRKHHPGHVPHHRLHARFDRSRIRRPGLRSHDLLLQHQVGGTGLESPPLMRKNSRSCCPDRRASESCLHNRIIRAMLFCRSSPFITLRVSTINELS